MPIRPLNVSPSSEAELATIIAVSPASLREALSSLRSARDIVSPAALRKVFNQALPEDVSLTLAKQLIALGGVARQSAKSPSEIFERLDLALQTRWKDKDHLERWNLAAPIFRELLANANVATAVKAVDLSFDFEHNYDRARILTDIRPIFDEPRRRIIGAIVGHRLRLSYHDADTNLVTMTIAMDLSDIAELQNACKEAIEKASVADEFLEKKAGLALFVGGEDNVLT